MNGDFYLGPWLVQPSLGRVSQEGQIVQVRPKVMDLLVYMAGAPGAVISKETLLSDVWRTDAISESALTRTITELRSAVRDDVDRPRFLETIPKRGYRLIAPVRPVESQEESRATRRRIPTVVIVIVALLITGTLALLVFEMDPSEPSETPRVRPLTAWPGFESGLSFSPDGNHVALAWSGEANDNSDIYVKGIDDDSRRRLTTDPEPDLWPAWSPDGRAIAFVRDSNRGAALYVVPAAGGPERFITTLKTRTRLFRFKMLDWAGNGALVVADQNSPDEPFHLSLLAINTLETQQLTSPPANSPGDIRPAVSPDGQTVAFTRALAAAMTSDIYRVPVSGGEPIRVTFDDLVITALSWSEDGGSIVFSSERGAMAGAGSLWRVRVEESTTRPEPEQLPGIGQRATGVAIARRGRRVAYQEQFNDTNFWRVAATGDGPAQLLVSSTREESGPDYSPDGTRMAFASNRSGNWEVWVASSDGSHQQKVTSFGGAPAWHPRWSPNGGLLAFSHTSAGNTDIYTITPEGSNPRQLTADPFSDHWPSWSRNGDWVYFSSNRSGTFEIWKTRLDDPGRLLKLTHGGGTRPRESTDGRLLYIKRTDSGLEIWSTGVDGGAETRLLGPLYSDGGWAPDRDGIYFIEPGRRIAYYRFATGTITPIVALAKDASPHNTGLALSPDGRWLLYSQMDRAGSDTMLIENFR